MPVTWDDTKERQFLMAIIHVSNTGSQNWNQIANLLNAQNSTEDFVGNALRQKFAKMKKTADEQHGPLPAASADGAPPKTPSSSRTTKKTTGETPASSTGKRKSKKSVAEDTKDDEEDGSGSPKKKVKTEMAASEDEADDQL
ncbi:hypothetical protein CERZMDRAFT_87748 [Cercospora zeae-maydis SCOH1-5]|uniref:Myb-like domain-containing protein n=1 Tax=Cercospora zeae-maydis SCOH1-5 TaxID=717836 RepID=A0A6A6F1K3_9PEZI|nr:hypothetical protein CERZMDRAFT_87748 [Cercospora zeae-maydis SCOH1-5]